jgi:hypothetical protein
MINTVQALNAKLQTILSIAAFSTNGDTKKIRTALHDVEKSGKARYIGDFMIKIALDS